MSVLTRVVVSVPRNGDRSTPNTHIWPLSAAAIADLVAGAWFMNRSSRRTGNSTYVDVIPLDFVGLITNHTPPLSRTAIGLWVELITRPIGESVAVSDLTDPEDPDDRTADAVAELLAAGFLAEAAE